MALYVISLVIDQTLHSSMSFAINLNFHQMGHI